jgi:hypothetical protein
MYGAFGRPTGSDLAVAAFLFSDGIIEKVDEILAIRRFFWEGRSWHSDCNLGSGRWVPHSTGIPPMFFSALEEETQMDSNYMFLCGVMWCKFGQQEAGKELLRAASSGNPDMSALARAMLAKGARRLRDLERRAQIDSRTILEESLCG